VRAESPWSGEGTSALAITFDAIEPRAGTLIGFDFQVNDDGLGNQRARPTVDTQPAR
jgi:hypothetical protein